MKLKGLLPSSRFRKDKTTLAFFCLLMFLSGCFEDHGKKSEKKKPSGSDNNKSRHAKVMMPKSLHDGLMAEQDARCQELGAELEFVSKHLQNVQAERDKLLAYPAKFNELKLALAATQEELKRITAEAEEYKAASQATAGSKSAASAQAIRQLTASNSQLSKDLATSKQRTEQLELSVSRIQNPANMLKIRQLNLETVYLSKELAGREQTIQELQASLTSSREQFDPNLIRQLKSQNTALSQSLARSEKRLKDAQALQNKPKSQVDPKLVRQLEAKNAELSAELDKVRKQLAQLVARPKDDVKTLAEWKIKLRNQGLINVPLTPAQLATSIGKPHDKEDRTPSGDGDEAIFTWRDSVKVDLEIHTIDGKIEMITYDK